ncbi:gliding motility-associated C-terminal domain-containing protein [bacterium]|nr:gliding motility-associated C-terminal domain-containing protein [bacterium]
MKKFSIILLIFLSGLLCFLNALGYYSFTEEDYSDFYEGTRRNVQIISPDPLGYGNAALRLAANDTIYVLQVYPDGHCQDCIAQSVYLYEGTGSPVLNFKIHIVPISYFNNINSVYDSITVSDPLSAVSSRTTLEHYDIVYFGIANGYGGVDNDLSSLGASTLRQFAQLGRGVVLTHDTIARREGPFGARWPDWLTFVHDNFNELTDITGLRGEWVSSAAPYDIYNEVFLEGSAPSDHSVLHRPFDLPASFDVTDCHPFGEDYVAGQIWYRGPDGQIYMHTYNNTDQNSFAGYFSTGHAEEYSGSGFRPLEWEAKAMINTMYYAYFGGRGTGVFFSQVTDMVCEVQMDTVLWTGQVPGASSMLVELRTSYDLISWTPWIPLTNGEPVPSDANHGRYFQYAVVMNRGGTGELPVFSSVTFNFFSDSPLLTLLEPTHYTVSACTCQSISFHVSSESDILLETIQMELNGELFGPDYFTYFHDESLLVFNSEGSVCFEDGEFVYGQVVNLQNTTGCPFRDTVSFYFILDLSPPVVFGINPPPDTVVTTAIPNISMFIRDSLSPVDPSSIELQVNGSVFRLPSPFLIWSEDELILLTGDTGLELGDTVEVCLNTVADIPDYCGPNYIDPVCWVFFVDTAGPLVELLNPPDSGYISCGTLQVEIAIYDVYGVDTSSIILSAGGHTYNYPSSMSYRGTILYFNPPLTYEDGEEAIIYFDYVEDLLGNHSGPFAWRIIFDLTSPDAFSEYPPGGAIIGDAEPVISIHVVDYLSGVDPACFNYNINGTDYLGSILDWDGEVLTLNTASVGLEFEDGDTVSICLTACDRALVCGSNTLEYCWFFSVNLSGPIANLIEPEHLSVTACDSQTILIALTDPNGVIPSSVVIGYNGEEYGHDSPYLIMGDTLRFFPPVSWNDGDLVTIGVLEAMDSLGNTLADVYSWQFQVDLIPPQFSNEEPPPLSVVDTTQPLLSVELYDSIAGVDTASIVLYVYGETIPYGSPGMSYTDDRLIFDPVIYGIAFEDVETLDICLEAADEPDWCDPNLGYWCWSIIIDLAGPRARIIIPAESTFTACSLQNIGIFLYDPTGINQASIQLSVNSEVLNLTDSRLEFVNDSLWFEPAIPWEHGDSIYVALLSAQDSLGNFLKDTLQWTFFTDYQGPVAIQNLPHSGNATYCWQETVSVILYDSLSGVDPNSIMLLIEDTIFGIGDPGVSLAGDTLKFYPELANYYFAELETINIEVRAVDSPHYCEPNGLYNEPFTWWFFILDDDTIRPQYLDYKPKYWPEDSGFYIYIALFDSSGIYDPLSTMDTQAAVLIWDYDGELEVDYSRNYAQFYEQVAETSWFISRNSISPQDAQADFVFRLRFWDNDADFAVSDRRSNQTPDLPVNIVPCLVAHIIQPLPHTTTSCADQMISLWVKSIYDFEYSSLILTVNDSSYSFSQSQISIDESLVIWDPGSIPLPEGLIEVELRTLNDIYGIPLAYPLHWSFYIDLSPPELNSIYPSEGEMVPRSRFYLEAVIQDYPSGIEEGSFQLQLFKNGGASTFDYPCQGLSWSPIDSISGLFEFDPNSAGYPFSDGDSFTVILSVTDNVDYCTPNQAEWEFHFWLEPEFNCWESTDPFTPNEDGFNDRVRFTYPNLFSKKATLEIYDMKSRLVYSRDIEMASPDQVIWEGKDDDGRDCPGGVYFYILKLGNEKACKGTITLAR